MEMEREGKINETERRRDGERGGVGGRRRRRRRVFDKQRMNVGRLA